MRILTACRSVLFCQRSMRPVDRRRDRVGAGAVACRLALVWPMMVPRMARVTSLADFRCTHSADPAGECGASSAARNCFASRPPPPTPSREMVRRWCFLMPMTAWRRTRCRGWRSAWNTPGAVAAVGAYTIVGTRRVRQSVSGDLLKRLLVRNLFANGGQLLIRAEAIGAGVPHRYRLWRGLGVLHSAGAARTVRARRAVHRCCLCGSMTAVRIGGWRADPALSGLACRRSSAIRRCLRGSMRTALAAIRRRTRAENAWIVGARTDQTWKNRAQAALGCVHSLREAPSVKRAALLAASHFGVGPFVRYARANFACNEPTSPCGRKMMNTTSSVP